MIIPYRDQHEHYDKMPVVRAFLTTILFILLSVPLYAGGTLRIYFIDTEGGQSTLFVFPSGQTMLVDTGNVAPKGRDPRRIAAVAGKAGVNRIDYLLITHYHSDHVGGVPELAKLLPISNFIDHGLEVEKDDKAEGLVRDYVQVREKSYHILAKPGDRIPIAGIDVQVLTSAGEEIASPLPGAGAVNRVCASTPPSPLRSFGKRAVHRHVDLVWKVSHH